VIRVLPLSDLLGKNPLWSYLMLEKPSRRLKEVNISKKSPWLGWNSEKIYHPQYKGIKSRLKE